MKVSWRRRRFAWGLPLGLVCTLFFQANSARADLDSLSSYGDAAGTENVDISIPGQISVTAGGSDFWGGSDNGVFFYDSNPVSGDFTAIVRSTTFSGDPLAGEWGRSGLMARVDGAAANSPYVATIRKSGGGVGITMQGRRQPGGGTENTLGDFAGTGGLAANSGLPVWLALHRQGDWYYAQYAPDAGGVPGAWSTTNARPATAGLDGGVQIGLAHQAHTLPRVNTATFDNYAVGALDPNAMLSVPQPYFTYTQTPNGKWNRVELQPLYSDTYDNAAVAAAGMTYNGAAGHLATVRNVENNRDLNGLLQPANVGSAWIGLDDIAVEGEWRRSQDGVQVWQGLAGGSAVGGEFTRWNAGEPNDSGGEDAAELGRNTIGGWNDLPNANIGVTRSAFIEFETQLDERPRLPGPGIAPGAFGVRMVYDTVGNFQHVRGVEALIYSGTGRIVDSHQPVVNFKDQNSGDGSLGGGTPFPGDDPGNADENNFALFARGRVHIPTAGVYTFGFRGDDGAQLRILGHNFDSAVSIGDAGHAEPGAIASGNVITYPNPTGDGYVLGQVTLPAGNVDLEYMFYENGGGAHTELFAAPGAHTSFNGDFRLVGEQAFAGITPATLIAPLASALGGSEVPGWDVGRVNGPNSLAAAITALTPIINDPITNPPEFGGTYPTINFTDPEGGGGDIFGGQVPFPGDQVGVGEDNFAIGAVTLMSVQQEGDYRFTVLGDDGARFRIYGTDGQWTAGGIANTDTGGTPPSPTDGFIIPGCCSDGWGQVHLTPGEYYVELIWNEIGGGAYVNVRYSVDGHGDFLLGSNANGARTAGLQLVPEPSSFVLAGFAAVGLAVAIRRRRRG